MQSHLGPPSNIPSQPYPRRAHESKRPAACPTVHGPNLSVNLHLICISVSPKYIDIFLTLPPPASLSLSLSLPPSLPLSHTHTHTHTHTARLFLLEMPGGLGSTIWSPPSAKDTFAGFTVFLPTGHYPVHGVGEQTQSGSSVLG